MVSKILGLHSQFKKINSGISIKQWIETFEIRSFENQHLSYEICRLVSKLKSKMKLCTHEHKCEGILKKFQIVIYIITLISERFYCSKNIKVYLLFICLKTDWLALRVTYTRNFFRNQRIRQVSTTLLIGITFPSTIENSSFRLFS